MHFLIAHRLFFGLAADALTLIGALTLAKEAFGRLRDLTGNRISEDFNKRFPGLPLIDQEKAAAARIVRYAFFGCTLMIFGFSSSLSLASPRSGPNTPRTLYPLHRRRQIRLAEYPPIRYNSGAGGNHG
jgi:hypothetical protein